MFSIRVVLGAFAVALLGFGPVQAAPSKPYPTNRCVSTKQKEAGRYCRRVLEAWAQWETRQDSGRRDAAIAQAAAKLATAWAGAERRASRGGVDCAETTLSAAAVRALVDPAAAALVAQVNDGLSLAEPGQARCGAALLLAAASRCAGLLDAERKFVLRMARDPEGTRRAAAQSEARAAFDQRWAATVAAGCPTMATQATAGAAIDGLVAAVVRDTIVSPQVDETRYSTISPTGTIRYLGKALTPRCIKDTPYHFFVRRGSVNKLVVYYQGGGACWDQLTCGVPVCDPSVDPNGPDNLNLIPLRGFVDPGNPANPFRDWHVVVVSYCSCDIHFGDAAQDYANVNPAAPVRIEHRGFHNARVVEKWAREHFVAPEVVFVTGSSAGAYGAWFHAPLLHRVWPAARFHVLADAGNGVITQSFRTTYFPNWNFSANLPRDIPGLRALIDSGAGIPEYTELVARQFPATTWAHYSTAFDGGSGGQTGFYNLMLNGNNPLAALTWWEGSCAFFAQLRAQALATAAAVPENYRYYIGSGSRHTMWGHDKVYTDTTGGVPTIRDWVVAMLQSRGGSADPAWTNVECANCGLLLPGDPRPSPLVAPFTQVGSDVVIQCE